MEEHLIKSWKERGVSDPTIKLYLFQLRQLGGNLENIDFLKDVNKNLEKLSKYKTNTIRTKLIAIIACLKTLNEPELLKQYSEIVAKINSETDNTSKSKTQEENWISKEDIMNLWKSYEDEVRTFCTKRKITEKQYDILLRFMVLSLYTLITPRRNADYGLMKLVKKFSPDLSNEYNYLDIKNRKFYFMKYKTAHVYKTQCEDIPENLWNVIKIYLKYHPSTEFFLCDFEGRPLPHANSITLLLNKIFGKKIGCSMLRNIMATDDLHQIQPLLDQVKQKAEEMGTSMSSLLGNYIKRI
jgi:hypothetical protein